MSGCLLGTAVGDALGLPFEGLTRRRRRRLFGGCDRYRLLLGRGMVSDDTDHACMTAQALIASAGKPRTFLLDLARRIRWWLLGLPCGIGMATLKSAGLLWIGVPPTSSGIRSAGNGAAMRSPVIGVAWGHRPRRLRALVKLSSRLTHTDPRAFYGALAVAVAAQVSAASATVSPGLYLQSLRSVLVDPAAEDFFRLLETAALSAGSSDTPQYCRRHGMAAGVTGFVNHTVPAVIHCWLRHPDDYAGAVVEMIDCGGDTDTTAAILGGIVGTRVGPEGIPAEWQTNLLAWPQGPAWMAGLARELATVCTSDCPGTPPRSPLPALTLRNLLLTITVLCHGFRRLAPPY